MPTSYHGTGHSATKSISQTGYDLTKHKHFAYGRDIYSTLDINVAKVYAKSFTQNGQQYSVFFKIVPIQKNVIKLFRDETGADEYWISPNDTDVRPYGVYIMKKS
jgi:hypothetical protein